MNLQVKSDFVFYVIVCFLQITWGFSIKILRKTFDSFLFTNLILVRIAALLSVPVTLLFIRKWLNNFAYKASINWWVFIISFTIAAVIVLLTVFIHSYKASRINPVDVLRYEWFTPKSQPLTINAALFNPPASRLLLAGVFIKICANPWMHSHFLFNFSIDCENSDISIFLLNMGRIVGKMLMWLTGRCVKRMYVERLVLVGTFTTFIARL